MPDTILKDQYASLAQVFQFGIWDAKFKLYFEELPTIVTKDTIGHSWIVGSSTNGLVGTNTGTQDGQQQVVGGAGRTQTAVRVLNAGNKFREHFRVTTFRDDGAPNTAYWDTTYYRLRMSSSTDHSRPYNTIATFSSIFLNSETISRATIFARETKFGNDEIHYFLSADGGGTYQEFNLNTEGTFNVTGTDLRLKVIFIGNGANETYLTDLRVEYVVV